MNYTFTAVELPLHADGKPRTEDIGPKMAELKAAGIDFLYLGSSTFLDLNRDVYTASALDNGIPILSPYERLVRDSQALISIAAPWYDTGRLAGAQAEKILIGGATPGDLPVERMTDFTFVINMDVARKLNLLPAPRPVADRRDGKLIIWQPKPAASQMDLCLLRPKELQIVS